MRLFWNNRIDASDVIVTTVSENPSFPAANLQNEQRSWIYRTLGTTDIEAVIFDLGSAFQNTAFLLINHDIEAGDTLHKIQANTSSSWGSPPFDQALTHDAGVISQLFDETYRYWRWTFTKTATAEIRQAGRIFLGTYYDTVTGRVAWDGYSRGAADNSLSEQSAGGQIFSLSRPTPRRFQLELSGVSTAERNQLLTIINALGTHTAFFIQVDANATAGDELSEILYVKFAAIPNMRARGMEDDSNLAWDSTFELVEAL